MGNDGKIKLRARIASSLAKAGVPASQAEAQATQAMLDLEKKGSGTHTVHAGYDSYVVDAREN